METKKINQLKGGVVLTYIRIASQLIIGLIYTPILLRILGQSEYGLYNLTTSVIGYLSLLSFGFGTSYIRFYSRYKKQNDKKKIAKLNGMFLVVFSVLGSIAVVVGIIMTVYASDIFGSELTRNQVQLSQVLMIILTVNIAFSFPSSLFAANIRANERFLFQNSLELIRTLTGPLLTLPLLLNGAGSIGMVSVILAVNLAVGIIDLVYAKQKLDFTINFRNLDYSLFKEIAFFSFFIFIHMIVDQVNWNVDKFLIGRFHGTPEVAIYSVGALILTYYQSLGVSISSVFTPRVHEINLEENANNKLTDLLIKVGRIQVIIVALVLLGFIFFGKPFIYWWAGSDYSNTYYVILLLTIPSTVGLIQMIGHEVLRAKGLHKGQSLIYLIITILNIVVSIYLTMIYKSIGAAFGTAIAQIIGKWIIMNIYYHRKAKLDILKFWKEILKLIPSLILPILFGIIYSLNIDIYNIWYFAIGIIIFVITYISSIWILGMNSYEKQLISKPLKKIIFNKNKL